MFFRKNSWKWRLGDCESFKSNISLARMKAIDIIPKPAAAEKVNDLEIKDAQLIFASVWQDLETEFGREKLRFPKEIILLGGAPGAGKGTNTAFIAKTRGLTCPPIVISALLDSPEAKALKDAGNMVGDREVVGLLLRELLRKEYETASSSTAFPAPRCRSSA